MINKKEGAAINDCLIDLYKLALLAIRGGFGEAHLETIEKVIERLRGLVDND